MKTSRSWITPDSAPHRSLVRLAQMKALFYRSFFLTMAACSGSSQLVPPPQAPLAERTAESTHGPALPKELGAWVDAYVGGIGKGLGEDYAPSGMLLVAQGGRPVVIRSFGKANRATGAVADIDTQFRIASVTKQFTSIAIAQLVEKHRLQYTDPISKYLPNIPPAWNAITIHQLLTHTSGIADYLSQKDFDAIGSESRTHDQVIASVSPLPLEFTPGERYSYSNTNYFLLGMIIEKVSGESYEAYLQKNIFAPAGMTRSGTIESPSQTNVAIGYSVDVDDKPIVAPAINMSLQFADGGMHSTMRDFLAWDRALAGTTLASERAKEQMFTADKDGHAYGWVRREVEGTAVFEQYGVQDGFNSFITRVPARELLVVALSNSELFSAANLADSARRMALTGVPIAPPTETRIVPTDVARVRALAGDYVLTPECEKGSASKLPKAFLDSIRDLKISEERGHMKIKPIGQGVVHMFQKADGSFVAPKLRHLTVQVDAPSGALVLTQGDHLVLQYIRMPIPPTK